MNELLDRFSASDRLKLSIEGIFWVEVTVRQKIKFEIGEDEACFGKNTNPETWKFAVPKKTLANQLKKHDLSLEQYASAWINTYLTEKVSTCFPCGDNIYFLNEKFKPLFFGRKEIEAIAKIENISPQEFFFLKQNEKQLRKGDQVCIFYYQFSLLEEDKNEWTIASVRSPHAEITRGDGCGENFKKLPLWRLQKIINSPKEETVSQTKIKDLWKSDREINFPECRAKLRADVYKDEVEIKIELSGEEIFLSSDQLDRILQEREISPREYIQAYLNGKLDSVQDWEVLSLWQSEILLIDSAAPETLIVAKKGEVASWKKKISPRQFTRARSLAEILQNSDRLVCKISPYFGDDWVVGKRVGKFYADCRNGSGKEKKLALWECEKYSPDKHFPLFLKGDRVTAPPMSVRHEPESATVVEQTYAGMVVLKGEESEFSIPVCDILSNCGLLEARRGLALIREFGAPDNIDDACEEWMLSESSLRSAITAYEENFCDKLPGFQVGDTVHFDFNNPEWEEKDKLDNLQGIGTIVKLEIDKTTSEEIAIVQSSKGTQPVLVSELKKATESDREQEAIVKEPESKVDIVAEIEEALDALGAATPDEEIIPEKVAEFRPSEKTNLIAFPNPKGIDVEVEELKVGRKAQFVLDSQPSNQIEAKISDDFTTLTGCEEIIDRLDCAGLEAGQALYCIKNNTDNNGVELYKTKTKTWAKYCQSIGRSRRYCDDLIKASEVGDRITIPNGCSIKAIDSYIKIDRVLPEYQQMVVDRCAETDTIVTSKLVLEISKALAETHGEENFYRPEVLEKMISKTEKINWQLLTEEARNERDEAVRELQQIDKDFEVRVAGEVSTRLETMFSRVEEVTGVRGDFELATNTLLEERDRMIAEIEELKKQIGEVRRASA